MGENGVISVKKNVYKYSKTYKTNWYMVSGIKNPTDIPA